MWIKTYLFKIFVYVILVEFILQFSDASKCDRKPENTSASRLPSDGRFKFRILGDHDRYIPGENYTRKSFFLFISLALKSCEQIIFFKICS